MVSVYQINRISKGSVDVYSPCSPDVLSCLRVVVFHFLLLKIFSGELSTEITPLPRGKKSLNVSNWWMLELLQSQGYLQPAYIRVFTITL